MIGIVLWRDVTAGKAIIWCEDQGDLAFYSHPDTIDTFVICVGDWVCFDLGLSDDVRLAANIRVLQEPGCPGLVEDLVGEMPGPVVSLVSRANAVSDDAAQSSKEKPLGDVPERAGELAAISGKETPANVILFPSGETGKRKTA